jgi:hypothetical protein
MLEAGITYNGTVSLRALQARWGVQLRVVDANMFSQRLPPFDIRKCAICTLVRPVGVLAPPFWRHLFRLGGSRFMLAKRCKWLLCRALDVIVCHCLTINPYCVADTVCKRAGGRLACYMGRGEEGTDCMAMKARQCKTRNN